MVDLRLHAGLSDSFGKTTILLDAHGGLLFGTDQPGRRGKAWSCRLPLGR